MSLSKASPARGGRRAALALIAVSVCLDYLAQSMSFPVLPRLAQRLLGGDLAAAARWTGFLEVAWAIPQFLAAPLLGMLSDRFGRRPVIVLSLFGVAAELVMNALAPSVAWLMAGRILCGLTCGAQAAAMAYVADVTEPEQRAGAYGWVNAAMWTAIIFGPAAGGVLAAIDIRTPFWTAAGVALACALYGLVVLPESLPPERRTPLRWKMANPWGAFDLLLRRPGLLALGLSQLLLWLAFQGESNMMVVYTAFRYAWTPLAFGLFATTLAAANIGMQGGLAGRVTKWLGERPTVLVGLAFQAASMAAMGLAPTGTLFAAAGLAGVVGTICGPAMQAMMTARVARDEQGRLQGAVGSISSLTGIVAPIAFTQLFAWTIAPPRTPIWSGSTMLVGAALCLLAWTVVYAVGRTGPSIRNDVAGR
jgi:MFS transporter, DHA1 family, tetracycline resistance protein